MNAAVRVTFSLDTVPVAFDTFRNLSVRKPTSHSSSRSLGFWFSALASLYLVGGCAARRPVATFVPPSLGEWHEFAEESGSWRVPLPAENSAEIGFSTLQRTNHDSDAPWVLLVPGGGAPSRWGEQNGDGVHPYASTVEVYRAWARALASAGFRVLSYDKRTCHPSQNPLCRANPTGDLDAEGPSALARDVDAACAWLRAKSGEPSRLVLMTHSQGLVPVLRSRCAAQADALVMLAPIPRRIDHVMVHALEHRRHLQLQRAAHTKEREKKERLEVSAAKLRNQAGSVQAMFASMEQGNFAAEARVQGATLGFWRGWLQQTEQTQRQLQALKIPILVLLGSEDGQFGPDDRDRILRFGKLPHGLGREIPAADHHFLQQEKLSAQAVDTVTQWLHEKLGPPSA